MLVQLPNDAQVLSQRLLSTYKVETIYNSESVNFSGTEAAFLRAGHAYRYTQDDEFKRRVR